MARYLVTGGAGFIGSNVVLGLIDAGHDVVVLDDLSTGKWKNLAPQRDRFEWSEGSICERDAVDTAMQGVDYCIHLAAIPSVLRSVEDPVRSNWVNVEGSLNVFLAARDAGVKRVVVASSSSVYGQTADGQLSESLPIQPISPYGVGKACVEHYARVFSALYGMEIICLRYFNVFGPHQDAASSYAAVIPHFIALLLDGRPPTIHGDGLQARDFTYVENVVHANLLACSAPGKIDGIFNVACGGNTTILALNDSIQRLLGTSISPTYSAFRPGDIRYSCADVSRARSAFGYRPAVELEEGLRRTIDWYRSVRKDVE